jgi:ABC-2 type transport system permease protein
MLRQIWNLVTKEFIQFLRDPLLAAFVVLGPLLQLALLAQSTGRGVNHISLAVLDYDLSPESRALITALDLTERIDVRYYPRDLEQVGRLLDEGQAALALVVPQGFGRDFTDPRATAQLQLISDASNSVTASVGSSAAQAVISDFASARSATHLRGASHFGIDLRSEIRYGANLDIRPYTISAQMGFIVYQVTLMVAALGLARERELGTLEQIMVTPIRRRELIVGKAIPALIIGSLDFLLMFIVTITLFDVPMRGSFTLLFGMSVLFIAAEIGWGLTLSAHARTQQQAILFVFLLAIIDMSFSGYLVAVNQMPLPLQIIAQTFPMQHYLAIVRAVMLKGAGLGVLWPEIVALGVLGFAAAVIARRSVSRQLD